MFRRNGGSRSESDLGDFVVEDFSIICAQSGGAGNLLPTGPWVFMPGKPWPVDPGCALHSVSADLGAVWSEPGESCFGAQLECCARCRERVLHLHCESLLYRSVCCPPDNACARCGCTGAGSTFVTQNRLLEWESAAENGAEAARANVGGCVPQLDAGSGDSAGALSLVRAATALPAALPLLVLWACSKLISIWLNGIAVSARNQTSPENVIFLRRAHCTLGGILPSTARRNTTG